MEEGIGKGVELACSGSATNGLTSQFSSRDPLELHNQSEYFDWLLGNGSLEANKRTITKMGQSKSPMKYLLVVAYTNQELNVFFLVVPKLDLKRESFDIVVKLSAGRSWHVPNYWD